MDLSPEMATLSAQLTKIVAKKSVETIFDKIRAVKQKGDQTEIISHLEEIINELISDKNQLIQISQGYEEQLILQKISDTEIDYITNSVIPLLERILKESEAQEAKSIQSGLDVIKPILSKETFNIMQILGFNFKHAVGEPLTELVAALITSKVPDSSDKAQEAQLLASQREIEYLKVVQDEEAFQRLRSFQ